MNILTEQEIKNIALPFLCSIEDHWNEAGVIYDDGDLDTFVEKIEAALIAKMMSDVRKELEQYKADLHIDSKLYHTGAVRFQKLAAYLVSSDTTFDDLLVAQTSVAGIASVVDQMKG